MKMKMKASIPAGYGREDGSIQFWSAPVDELLCDLVFDDGTSRLVDPICPRTGIWTHSLNRRTTQCCPWGERSFLEKVKDLFG